MGFNVSSPQRAPRTEQFFLVPASLTTGTAVQNASGCTEGTFRCTVVKNATGAYTINYNAPFSRKPVVQVTAEHASAGYIATVDSDTSSASAVKINCFTATSTAADPTGVHVTVHGWDTADQVG